MMVWTSVPKAAIDEHNQAVTSKDDVCLIPQSTDRADVLAISQAGGKQRGSDSDLEGGIAAPVRSHRPGNAFCCSSRVPVRHLPNLRSCTGCSVAVLGRGLPKPVHITLG